ncbi:TPA: hypothetical protein ACF2D8_005049 [Serratia marcescens]
MMKSIMKTSAACLVAMVAGLSSVAVEAAPAEVTFGWDMPQGTCSVSSVQGATVAITLDNDPLLDGLGTPAYNDNWPKIGEASAPLTLNINECAGFNASATARPVVTVSGTLLTASNGGIPDQGSTSQELFRNSGTSVGFGILLVKDKNEDGSHSTDWATVNGENLYVHSDNTAFYLPGSTITGTGTIRLHAAVSCGRVGWCRSPALRAGTVSANIKFTFAYK